MNPVALLVPPAFLLLLLWVLRANLWRAILFVRPQSIRIEADAPAGQVKLPEELFALDAALRAAGFASLGSHSERPRLGQETFSYDYLHAQEKVYGTAYVGRDGSARLYLLTPTTNGGYVITANYRRPARERKGAYVSGALENPTVERLLKAHQRRVPEVGQSATGAAGDQEARLAAARAWFEGSGQGEVRMQNAFGLLWTLGTLGMVAAAILRALHWF
jgi:hypothetical protein